MLTIKDISPTPLDGQYWAMLNPLSLLKVRYGSSGSVGDEIFNFIRWGSGGEGEGELNIVCPLNDNFRLLRESYHYSECLIARDLYVDEFRARTGDVFEAINGMLVFAVLENGGVTLYSDEKLDLPDPTMIVAPEVIKSVVQRGPGPPIGTPVKSRYERIIDEAKTNFSMVRPVGGVFLRPKVKDPLLLSNTNTGTEGRVHTNLDLIKER
jgi:hypothetical protein